MSNRTAPRDSFQKRMLVAPLPSPFAPRSQLPTRCHSVLGDKAHPRRKAAQRLLHFSIWFSVAREHFSRGSASQEGELSGCGGSPALRATEEAKGVAVTSGCCSKTPSLGGDGEEGIGRRPPPSSGWEPGHYHRGMSFAGGGGGAEKLEAQGGRLGALASASVNPPRESLCPAVVHPQTPAGPRCETRSRLCREPRSAAWAAVGGAGIRLPLIFKNGRKQTLLALAVHSCAFERAKPLSALLPPSCHLPPHPPWLGG